MITQKSDYFFDLPEERIAQKPLMPRDQSRMMILNRTTRSIAHSRFIHFPDILQTDSLLVLNNSKVIPARLLGRRQTGVKLEILLIQETASYVWKCKVKNSSRIKVGEYLEFCDGKLKAELLEKEENGNCSLKFFYQENLYNLLEKFGYAPVPPYVHKARSKRVPRSEDLAQYQTVYAKNYGAIAAPTAGLHFTEKILKTIVDKNIEIAELTLHVGLGTFEPVRVDNIAQHTMHSEHYCITEESAEKITLAKKQNRKIVAIGTTSARTLEAAWKNEQITPGNLSTDIFIYPPYQFQVVDQLLTNFHLPESTLLMLVSAFAGKNFVLEAYRTAIAENYRFYSYGDCMLIK